MSATRAPLCVCMSVCLSVSLSARCAREFELLRRSCFARAAKSGLGRLGDDAVLPKRKYTHAERLALWRSMDGKWLAYIVHLVNYPSFGLTRAHFVGVEVLVKRDPADCERLA